MSSYKKISAQAVSLICAVTMIGSNLSVMPCMAEETTSNEEVTENTEIVDSTESGSILMESDEGNFHWAVTDQYELVITPNSEYKSTIPDYYELYENPDLLSQQHYLELFKPRPWDRYSGYITSVKICNGIEGIGGYAFCGMNRLENVYIAESVTYIGKNAFSNTSVKLIKMPKNLRSIGKNAFEKCSCLETIYLPEEIGRIGDYAFSDCAALNIPKFPDSLSYIGDYAFNGCTSLTGLDLPTALETIGEFAFSGCTELTNLNIPDSVTSIGKGAFKNCSGITDIKFGRNIAKIPWMGFENCTSITQAVIDNDTTKEVGSDAFKGCTALSSVYLGDSISYIGFSALSGCPLKELTVCNPDAIIGWGEGKIGVDDNSNMTIYGLPESRAQQVAQRLGINFSEIIGHESKVHKYADGLTWTIKDGHTLVIGGKGEIPDYKKGKKTNDHPDCPPWYGYRDSITEVIIGEGITRIGNDSMYFTPNLSDISLPSTLESIGEGAFAYCDKLKAVNLNCSIKALESETFLGCKSLESIDIPESVKSIGSSAFSYCESLKSVKIPGGITEISKGLFYSCNRLETVKLPDSIKNIGSESFQYCKSLKNINLGDNISKIGGYAFSDCTSLTNIKFGSSLKEICDDAFKNSGLTGNIIIPANVDKIHGDVFYNCKGIESYTILNPDILLDGWGGSNMGTICIEEKTDSGGIIRIITNTPTVFYGYRGSTTEAYANKYKAFTFAALDDTCQKGDVNLDGKITVSDLVILQQYLVKKASLTNEQWNCADIMEDGSVNVFDEALLRRKLIEFNKK